VKTEPQPSNREVLAGLDERVTHQNEIAMDNGAKRALIPLENKRSFLEVTGDIVEHVDPIFFGDPKTAAFKALGLN
jgi:predicted ATP-dependent Lon-type protease